MAPNEKYRQRLDALFADIECLAADPACMTPSVCQELEKLRARLGELEAEITENEERAAAEQSVPAPVAVEADAKAGIREDVRTQRVAPLLYEREQIGYAYSGNAIQPIQGTAPAMPENDAAITAPLTVSGQTVGQMQIEPPAEKNLTEEDVSLLKAVAQQASVQIQNLRLLAATERARSEAESATRRFIHEGWDSFLDGIQHHERLGYAYDQSGIAPYEEKDYSSDGFQESVKVMDEQVGTLYVKHDPSHPLTDEDKEMVAAIANRIAQQVENIRLLADAARARAEAETATRRLTGEGWQAYIAGQDEAALNFVYDSKQVTSLGKLPLPQDITFVQPLTVRGETIGRLAVAGWEEIPPEAADLASAIAERVSAHLENLRLLEQTQQRSFELEEIQTFLDSVVENLPTMLFLKDAEELRFVRWNKAAEELTGFIRESLIGKNDYDLFPKEEANFFISKDQQVLLNGQMLDISEEPIATAHQGIRYLHTRKVPIYGVDGKAKYLLGISEDITERKRAQEMLAQRANQLETVATLSTTASTVLDPDKLLQEVVDLTKERFGLYHAQIYLVEDAWNTLMLAAGAGDVGKQMIEAGQAIMLNAEKSLVAHAARERIPLIASNVQDEPDFLPNPLLPETRSEMAVPMIVGEKVLGILDVQSDVVGRFTEEDTNIMTTLALQVGIALQNARLYAAQTATVAQLRELDRLKSSFLANMSHELRTPLNSILGFADVILEELDGPLTENMNNDLKLIQKNGQHLLHLINDVLDMAKIESGKMNLAIEKFNLHEIIEEVTSITSPLASEKNLALFVEPESDREVDINADRTRLRQVMINLVNNAIKFTEKGRIAILVTREGDHVLIRVKDTGIGIPPEQLEAVFQEFVQVDTSTTRKVGGTGLGLPISRRLIEMHGGRLWAESSNVNGEGSSFYVVLPIEARVKKDDKETAK
jgi:PAS domain S-box-containing protein